MPLSTRRFTRLLALWIVVMAAGFAVVASAAPRSDNVDIYIDEAVPQISPDTLNHPMKAGSMKLIPLEKKQPVAPQRRPAPTNLPVGGLTVPQLVQPAIPAASMDPQSSSSKVMMLQGMRTALQKSGQNPDAPPTSTPMLVPVDEKSAPKVPAAALAPLADDTDSLNKASLDAANSGVTYQPGQEPRSLSGGKLAKTAAMKTAVVKDKGAKATDLKQAPLALDEVATPTAKAEPKAQASASIFGAPVEDDEEPVKPVGKGEAATTTTTAAANGKCTPSVNSWIKYCGEAGYPADYVGQIKGETRVACPENTTQDVWLSNSCAPPGAAKSALNNDTGASADLFGAAKVTDDKGASPTTFAAAPAIDPNAKVDAVCGAANGLATKGKPASDLCGRGESTDVSGDGPWRWTCKGLRGGMTISCAAPVAKEGESVKAATSSASTASASGSSIVSSIFGGSKSGSSAATTSSSSSSSTTTSTSEDAKCGEAHNVGTDIAPFSGLCARGVPSRVNGGGPWTWACSGTNGGAAAACVAPRKTDGVCGAANETGIGVKPARDLCSAGVAGNVTGDGPWHWTCSGIYGGAPVTCQAAQKQDAVCGSSTQTGHRQTPKDSLCNAGTASTVSGFGPWNWECAGSNGGAKVTCTAPATIDGVCGSANGASFEKSPTDNLCLAGKPGRVTGSGPWGWLCGGTDGGNTVSCVASMAAAETAKDKSASDADKKKEESKAAAIDGNCGTAANVGVATAPTTGLCASGSSGSANMDKNSNWVWDCKGLLGGSSVSCSAPALSAPANVLTVPTASAAAAAKPAFADARCGGSDGKTLTSAPNSGLCDAGKASRVTGSGPWSWNCAKGDHKIACAASKMVDGVCGSSNGSVQKSAPVGGLCAQGNATPVSGDGPWMWSCAGTGGGASISCSATAQDKVRVDGVCGSANATVVMTQPTSNLCDSGIASPIFGEGPWTWTCSGLNGGIASSCATSKTIPQAPPPPGDPVNGNCGPANGVAAVGEPVEGLCSSGTASKVSGNGPWNWNCVAANGGMSVSCTAPLMPPAPVNGNCGAANGVSTLVAPKSALCDSGIASAVNGHGPWTWTCSGTNGGGAVSCVAPMAGSGGGPLPSITTPAYHEDEAPVPKAAPAGLVTPQLLKDSKLDSGSSWADLAPPSQTPDLPAGTQPLVPPSFDKAQATSSKALAQTAEAASKSATIASQGKLQLDTELSVIPFDRNSDQVNKEATGIVRKLATSLSSYPNARITLTAYADSKDTTPREARRLSLARALAVRDVLTGQGIDSGRIDVRALGANVRSGDADRIDVKVN